MRSRLIFLVLFPLLSPTLLAASTAPKIETEQLTAETFPATRQAVLDELGSGGHYAKLSNANKRRVRAALESIDGMLRDTDVNADQAIAMEAEEINEILGSVERKRPGRARANCRETRSMGSNIRMKTVCEPRSSDADREGNRRALERMSR